MQRNKDVNLLFYHIYMSSIKATFATRLCESTSNLEAIQDIMGHANIETTMDIYKQEEQNKSN